MSHPIHEIPKSQDSAYIGYCKYCNDADRLIFLLTYSDGFYEHCMICNETWKKDEDG